eukprot:COSAG01_NODE_7008_length_3394_cov_3.696813_8_plen_69_part_00
MDGKLGKSQSVLTEHAARQAGKLAVGGAVKAEAEATRGGWARCRLWLGSIGWLRHALCVFLVMRRARD